MLGHVNDGRCVQRDVVIVDRNHSLRPIASMALVEGKAVGSSQHSSLAQGLVFTISGGSTPMFRHMNMPALRVFDRLRSRHGTTPILSATSTETANPSPLSS